MTPEYFAGHFDGEGCLHIADRGHLQCAVGTCYLPTLLQYQKQYGGSVSVRRKLKPSHKQAWVWLICSKREVGRFLLDVGPYLQEKKAQADVVVGYIVGDTPASKAGQELRRLKKYQQEKLDN